MKPQTFRAPNTQLALEQVQQEFGPEALIVSVRQIPGGPAWQVWKRSEVEVVAIPAPGSACVEKKEPAPSTLPLSLPTHTRTAPKDGSDKHEIEALLAMLSKRLDQTNQTTGSTPSNPVREKDEASPSADMLAPSLVPPPASLPSSVLASSRERLLAQGVAGTLVEKVVQTCAESLSPTNLQNGQRVRSHIQRQLEASVRESAHPEGKAGDPQPEHLSGQKSGARRVIFLVGASGSGKTSTCAKLASHFKKIGGKKVSWVCADTVRTGAIALARAYTDTLGIPLHLAYTPDELANAMSAEAASSGRGADIILVDTSACNPRSEEEIVTLGSFLTILRQRDVYLVASATSKDADLTQALAAFSPFRLDGLIFTKLDETDYYGSAYNLAWRSRLPMVYFTNGSHVEDLQPARADKLSKLLFGEKGYGI